ncbi:uncharacterized protein LOC122066985 [Macadamia integrifolia]|uniref:uncharacterized protein LOC122066985 n=1 Tax=Macadamia integrifolia TaxID=60698 RepID=UPI001C4F996B|nr:uncharacterized protein LOC122066985 [Macadamia integrifolia]
MAISHQEGLLGRGDDEPDSFVVDMERLCHGTDKDISPNSRITRSFSRKGTHKGERKSNATIAASNDKATDTVATNGDISFRGDGGVIDVNLAEKSTTVPRGTASVEPTNKQARAMRMVMNNENRAISSPRRHGAKRPLAAWLIGPRTVLAFFATLSSMGTILLIYFTLSMAKHGEDDPSPALIQ